LEQVALSLLGGQAILFVVQGLVYVFAWPERVVLYAVLPLLIACTALCCLDLGRGRITVGEYLTPLLAWMALTFLALAGSSLLVVQGLPGAVFDWWEHYRRAQVFLLRLPPETSIAGWTLAARGPLFNALTAVFMSGLDRPEYWSYSVLATLLNGQVLLPLALLLRRFVPLSTRAALTVGLVVLLMAPVFNWNLIFTWTKLSATGWILLALYLSLEGVWRGDSRFVAWGIAAMALAFLTHFLAFLYAVLLLPCLLYYAYARRLSVGPLLIGTAAGCLVVGGWMVFLVHQFGVEATLRANSTFGTYQGSGSDQAVKFERPPPALEVMTLNLAASVLPGPVRSLGSFQGTPLELPKSPRQITVETSGRVVAGPGQANSVFMVSELEGAVGWTGLALLVAAPGIAIATRGRGGPGHFQYFWCYFVLVGIPVNLWATRWYSVFGVLNQNLQPYLCLAVVFVVHELNKLGVGPRVLAALAWVCESGVRVGSILHFQMRELPIHLQSHNVVGTPPFSADEDYYTNYKTKISQKVVMLHDLVPVGHQAALFAVTLALAGLTFLALAIVVCRQRGGRGSSNSKGLSPGMPPVQTAPEPAAEGNS
jgi:hypothetical protein